MPAPGDTHYPLSKLIYIVDQRSTSSESETPHILVLHDRQQRASDAVAFAAPLRDRARIIGVEALTGIWFGKQIAGYTWYLGDLDHPDPLSFGLNLGEIEYFVLDTLDRRAESDQTLPYLLGEGQGGAMALAMAAVQPDRLSGVIAINAFFPKVRGWDPPLAPLDDLPILLLDQTQTSTEENASLQGEAIMSHVADWGAAITRQITTPDVTPHETIAKWLKHYPPRREQHLATE